MTRLFNMFVVLMEKTKIPIIEIGEIDTSLIDRLYKKYWSNKVNLILFFGTLQQLEQKAEFLSEKLQKVKNRIINIPDLEQLQEILNGIKKTENIDTISVNDAVALRKIYATAFREMKVQYNALEKETEAISHKFKNMEMQFYQTNLLQLIIDKDEVYWNKLNKEKCELKKPYKVFTGLKDSRKYTNMPYSYLLVEEDSLNKNTAIVNYGKVWDGRSGYGFYEYWVKTNGEWQSVGSFNNWRS